MKRFAYFVNPFFLPRRRFRRPQLLANYLISLTVSSGRRTIANRRRDWQGFFAGLSILPSSKNQQAKYERHRHDQHTDLEKLGGTDQNGGREHDRGGVIGHEGSDDDPHHVDQAEQLRCRAPGGTDRLRGNPVEQPGRPREFRGEHHPDQEKIHVRARADCVAHFRRSQLSCNEKDNGAQHGPPCFGHANGLTSMPAVESAATGQITWGEGGVNITMARPETIDITHFAS
jgi:hypothetical protein